MDVSLQLLETKPIAGKQLRCRFSQHSGVIAHTIEHVAHESTTPSLISMEQSPGDWPASPPWQELHAEQLSDGTHAMMLVGRAGKSHWSMSVTLDNEQEALLFDVACRFRERPEFLGTTYQRTECRSVQIITVDLDGEAAPKVIETDNRVVIDATREVKPPATLRWAYRITLP